MNRCWNLSFCLNRNIPVPTLLADRYMSQFPFYGAFAPIPNKAEFGYLDTSVDLINLEALCIRYFEAFVAFSFLLKLRKISFLFKKTLIRGFQMFMSMVQ